MNSRTLTKRLATLLDLKAFLVDRKDQIEPAFNASEEMMQVAPDHIKEHISFRIGKVLHQITKLQFECLRKELEETIREIELVKGLIANQEQEVAS